MAAEATAVSRHELHALVDDLPDGELTEARRLLTALKEPNPAYRVALLAPIDDEPLTPDELRATEECEAAYARRDWVSDMEVRR